MGEGHPEQPDRLRAIERALESEVFQVLARDIAPRAEISAIARVHPQDYIEAKRFLRSLAWEAKMPVG